MNDNEKLIKEAAEAMRRAHVENGFVTLFTDWARVALAVFEKAHTPTNGSCWDAAPRIVREGVHDPMPTLCELPAGHLGAHHNGLTEWMHSPATATPTDDERETSGYRATLIREAREHADRYRRFDDTESLVSTLVEMSNALASAPAPQVEPSDAQVVSALNAMFPYSASDDLEEWLLGTAERMRAALRAAGGVR